MGLVGAYELRGNQSGVSIVRPVLETVMSLLAAASMATAFWATSFSVVLSLYI